MDEVDYTDRLIDQLLLEELGLNTPPNLLHSIRRRLHGQPMSLWKRFSKWGGLAVVFLLLLGAVYSIAHDPSPVLSVSGAYHVVSGVYREMHGRAIERGCIVIADGGEASLVLGRHCHLTLRSGSHVRIEGSDKNEQVYLLRGEVRCIARDGVSSLRVRTAAGTVTGKGAEFTVRRINESEGSRIFVKVAEGQAIVAELTNLRTLYANEDELFPIANAPPTRPDYTTLTGTFKETSEGWIVTDSYGIETLCLLRLDFGLFAHGFPKIKPGRKYKVALDDGGMCASYDIIGAE